MPQGFTKVPVAMVRNVALMTETEIDDAAEKAAAAAYATARRLAAERLAAGPAAPLGETADTITNLLMTRDLTDPKMGLLTGFEKDWAILVVAIIGRVMRPTAAVADARRRGATWQSIADALGVTAPAARERFSAPRRRHG